MHRIFFAVSLALATVMISTMLLRGHESVLLEKDPLDALADRALSQFHPIRRHLRNVPRPQNIAFWQNQQVPWGVGASVAAHIAQTQASGAKLDAMRTAYAPNPVSQASPVVKIRFNRSVRPVVSPTIASSNGAAQPDDSTSGYDIGDSVRTERIARVRTEDDRAARSMQSVVEPLYNTIHEQQEVIARLQRRVFPVAPQKYIAVRNAAPFHEIPVPRYSVLPPPHQPLPSPEAAEKRSLEPQWGFKVPGPVTVDHIVLPGGMYEWHAPPVADAPPPVVPVPPTNPSEPASSDEYEEVGGDDSGNAASSDAAAQPETPSSDQSVDADDLNPLVGNQNTSANSTSSQPTGPAYPLSEENDILDTSADLSNGVDTIVVRNAAEELQRQVIAEMQPSQGSLDGTLDTTTGMTNGVDVGAVKSAAIDLQRRVIDASSKAATLVGTLDTVSGMTNGVDFEAVKSAAERMQRQEIAKLRAGAKDARLETLRGMTRGLDLGSVESTAKALERRLISQAGPDGARRGKAQIREARQS